jgi:hypothetical protein
MHLKNLPNDYQRCFPDFDKTPKAVIAAMAYSFALTQCEGDSERAKQLIIDEWTILHQNQIISQKPPKRI